jgi:hypothetical protein
MKGVSNMAIKKYIGARYAPKFMGAWNKDIEYAALCVVYANDQSYVSRKTVPANTEITNTEFWIKSADWNAQVTQYNQNVERYEKEVLKYSDTVNDLVGKTVYTYNTKDDMSADKRVQLNDTLMTCGHAKVNDKKGSFYKAVATTSSKAIALQNDLYAEPFELTEAKDSDIATPQQFGAIGDGIADDTAAVQAALNSDKGIVVIKAGTYNVKSMLSITNNVCVYMANNAILKATAAMDSVISIDNTSVPAGPTALSSYVHFSINGGQIDGNGKAKYGIKATNYHRSSVKGMCIFGFTTHGIHCKDEPSETGAYLTGENLTIIGNNSDNSIGVYAPGNDEEWNKVSIINCKLGFQCGANHIITNCTTWRTSKDYYEGSFGILIGGDNCSISNFTCDGTNFFMNIGPSVNSVLINGLKFVQPFTGVTKMIGVTFGAANSNCAVSITGINQGTADVDLLVNTKNEKSTVIGRYGTNSYPWEIAPLTNASGCGRFTEDNAKKVLARLGNVGITATSVMMFACDPAGQCCYLFWNGTTMSQTDVVAGIATNNNGTISSNSGAVSETVLWYG